MRSADSGMEEAPSGALAPRVSIVVPTYNRLSMLKETVSSILCQTFPSFELIIVDNMSTDGTEAYVRSIGDRRVRYYRNPNSGVIAVNRNLGIRESKASLVSFCDDDDLWVPDKLKTQVGFMDSCPDVGLCFGYAEDFGETATSGLLRFPKDESDSIRDFESLLLGNKIATLTVMVRKACLDEVGLFDEDPALRALEDYDLWLRVARRFRIACVGETLGRYRVHASGMSRNEVAENRKLLRLLEKFKKNGWLSDRLARGMEANICRMIANAMLFAGESGYRAMFFRSARLAFDKKTALGLLLCLLPAKTATRAFKRLKASKLRYLHRPA